MTPFFGMPIILIKVQIVKMMIRIVVALILISGCANPKQENVIDNDLRTNRAYVSSTFDENKGSIYSIYNRSLRDNPTLGGKIYIKLIIAPSGDVLDAKIESSELDNPRFERKLLVKIKSFKFEPRKSTKNIVLTYPLDFIPR